MTPEQALELLDKATAMLQLPRQDHLAVIEALKVLNETITPTAAD